MAKERTDLPIIFSTPIQFPLIPDEWTYDESINRIQPKMSQWKNFTIEIATELYIAQLKLASPGRRTDLISRESRLPTFKEYCEEIGIAIATAYRWIKSVFGVQFLETEQQPSSPAIEGHEYFCSFCGAREFQSTVRYIGGGHLHIADIYCSGCGVKLEVTDDMIEYFENINFVVQWERDKSVEQEIRKIVADRVAGEPVEDEDDTSIESGDTENG